MVSKLNELFFGRRSELDEDEEAVRAALNEWQTATRYFESVKDPDLMDFAIYDMEAARRKYIFLLKRASAR